MSLNINKLLEVLQLQKNLINELAGLADQQFQALQQEDFIQIQNITNHQEYIAKRMASLEQRRQGVLEEYSQMLGFIINHISQLQPYVDNNDFAAIQAIGDEIVNNSRKLQQTHELNSLLLKQGLIYTTKILGVLNADKGIYGKSGNLCQETRPGLLNTNI
jgi:flagellar biosynthesis/type III secretory pathway chaperone